MKIYEIDTEIIDKKENSLKKYICFIKEYFTLISVCLISVLLIIDYFIFTDVLHLNQGYFFNNLLGVVAREQPLLLIFIFLPILLIILLFIILYKLQFNYLNKLFNENYRNSYKIFNKNKIKVSFFGTLIILFGDIIVFLIIYFIFNIFSYTPFKMTIFPFLFTSYILFFIYNSIVFYLILLISSTFIIKFKNIYLISFFLTFSITLKLLIYPFFQFLPYINNINIKSFLIFILLNLMFFIPVIIVILGKIKATKDEYKKNRPHYYTLLEKTCFFIIIIFGINFSFYNLNKTYYEPYNIKDFWNKLPENSLLYNNISLLINPIKIIKDNNLEINIICILNKINNKNPEFRELIFNIHDSFIDKELDFFYIPFENYRIVFIKNEDNEEKIITFYGEFRDDKLVKILDVGYIDLVQNIKGL